VGLGFWYGAEVGETLQSGDQILVRQGGQWGLVRSGIGHNRIDRSLP
jgi:hypothetical protein